MSDRPKIANLVDGHLDDLLRSGLSAETIITAGFYSAPGSTCSQILGYGVGPGLIIPYPANGGPSYSRVKLDHAGPDGKRYRSPKDRGNRLYLPPTLDPKLLANVKQPLWITEGEKKCLKAVQEGLPCIALPGVWSWKQKQAPGSTRSRPIPDLDGIPWTGRPVSIVFDSDLVTNAAVQQAERYLARELARRGAHVWAIRLPPGPEGAKVGLDDYLVRYNVEAFSQLEPVRLAGWPTSNDIHQERDPEEPDTERRPSPWMKALPAPEFITMEEPVPIFIADKLLAPGAVTEFFAPRGIGKSLIAHALLKRAADAGHRALLIDRDNPRGEVRRRLKAWGAVTTPLLKVLTREDAPPLADKRAWQQFPVGDYAVVCLDSLDAASEGAGEGDSSKPAQAIAPLLDIAHGAHGPALLVLGNTIKSGKHNRGSGVIEDRADISYEVRDATDFRPSGTKDWWHELPEAGVGAWAERASRRKGRTTYRLAFIPSKFRLGEEPEPFCLELDLTTQPWVLRDVTDALLHAKAAAREAITQAQAMKTEEALAALQAEVDRREQADQADSKNHPLTKTEAADILHKAGLSRDQARTAIDLATGTLWRQEPGKQRSKLLRSLQAPETGDLLAP